VRGGWENLKAVIPGGSSVPGADRPKQSATTAIMDFDGCAKCSVGPRHGGVIVMDKSTDIIKAIWRLAKFLQARELRPVHALPRRHRLDVRVMERLVKGEAEVEEIDMLLDVTKQVEGHTICALGDAAAWPIQGLIRHFREEIEDRIKPTASRRAPSFRAATRDRGGVGTMS
jgi:NADH-quinone oxidoreductase subunit F